MFLGVVITPSIAINNSIESISSGNTLYVGGTGPGNYTFIQDAIDNASDGDTVFVYDDSSPYYENVIVDKSINLIGEDRETTIIKNLSHGPLIKVISDNVLITNFKIHQDAFHKPSIATDSVNNIEICNMFFNGSGFGSHIHILRTTSSKIHGNVIRRKTYGVFIEKSQYATIYNNEIYYCSDAIKVENANYIKIYNNYLHHNSDGIWHDSSCINISSNIITYNHQGIQNYYGGNITITNNNISNSETDAIWIKNVCEIIISYNNITNNKYGIFIRDEVLSGSQKRTNIITCNNFINNEKHSYFTFTWPFENQKTQIWDKNYWNDLILDYKKIKGRFYLFDIPWGMLSIPIEIRWFKFDWNPATEPYDIEV